MNYVTRTVSHIGSAALFALALAGNPALAAEPAVKTASAARVTTASGLQYEELQAGSGAVAQSGNEVTVNYTGWLQQPDGSAGRKFDSSLDRNQPFVFPLGGGRVIRGWDEGVQGMKVGGMRRLIVPAKLGYGERGAAGVIPPNATLIFDVTLLSVR